MKLQGALLGILSCLSLNTFVLSSSQAVTITSSGIWTEAQIDPIDDIGTTTLEGLNTNQISWGGTAEFPIPTEEKSSYVFNGTSQDLGDNFLGQEFDLGLFTHNNFPIFAPFLTGATLEVSLEFASGVVQTFDLTFLFKHFETPNFPDDPETPRVERCAAGGNEPCPDRVRLLNSGISEDTVEIDGVTYFLRILGFRDVETGLLTRSFLTDEAAVNQAFLVAELTRAIPWQTDALAGSAGLLFVGLVYNRYRKTKTSKA